MCLCAFVYVYLCSYLCVCVLCKSVCISVCVYSWVCVCVCVCVSIYIHDSLTGCLAIAVAAVAFLESAIHFFRSTFTRSLIGMNGVCVAGAGGGGGSSSSGGGGGDLPPHTHTRERAHTGQFRSYRATGRIVLYPAFQLRHHDQVDTVQLLFEVTETASKMCLRHDNDVCYGQQRSVIYVTKDRRAACVENARTQEFLPRCHITLF